MWCGNTTLQNKREGEQLGSRLGAFLVSAWNPRETKLVARRQRRPRTLPSRLCGRVGPAGVGPVRL